MAAIGASVAAASALSPRAFLRLFGISPDEVTGAAAFGWHLFAVRTAYISRLALRGNATAREAFLPIQLLDQAAFWHAFKTRSFPVELRCSRRPPRDCSSFWTFIAEPTPE